MRVYKSQIYTVNPLKVSWFERTNAFWWVRKKNVNPLQ